MALYQDIPDRLEGRPIFQSVWGRMHRRDKNYVAAFCGETGSGKSYSALRFCEFIDPTFSVDRIAWNLEEFVELVNQDLPPGSMILLEEASTSLNAKSWWEKEQQLVQQILDTWRHFNRGAVLTLPSFNQLQKDSRGRCHALAETRGIDHQRELVKLRYRYVQQDSESGDLYLKYHRLPDPETGIEKAYTGIGMPKPSEALRVKYEEEKQEFTSELNQQILDELRAGGGEDADVSPQEVVEKIRSNGGPEHYLKEANNGREYIDASLIEFDYDISARKAKTVKSALARDLGGGEG